MRRLYMNLSIRYKIFIPVYLLIMLITLTLGYYSYRTSENQLIHKVSGTNLGVVREIENSVSLLRKSIDDWATVFSLAAPIQEALRSTTLDTNPIRSSLYTGATASVMNQMLVTKNFDYIAIYGNSPNPLFQESTDGSNGPYPIADIRRHPLYGKILEKNGASLWFPLNDKNNTFIEDNRNEKIGMSRMVRSVDDGSPLGMIFIGVNTDTIRSMYLRNMFDDNHGFIILSDDGSPLLTAGFPFFDPFEPDQSGEGIRSLQGAGSKVMKIGGKELLVSYSDTGEVGWRIIYAVPLDLLTKELNSIKVFVLVLIMACLLLSIPFMMALTTFLTAPVKTLQHSMKRFQNGRFDERVDIKYRDEIGELGRGYNSMVANIKNLVDEVYVLQIREKEAELKALQSQINPHFLYNMLDTIFWEAEAAGQGAISEMIVNLSRLFRLSLNRGKSFTSVRKEKEFISLYLSLQKMRFRDQLEYRLDIPEELDSAVILKLILQPFIENALNHGIERKRGGGTLLVSGEMADGKLRFCIEDNGAGMEEEKARELLKERKESDVYTSEETGGYGTRNVVERLRHFYKDDYSLNVTSKPGEGTRVELIVPVLQNMKEENEA